MQALCRFFRFGKIRKAWEIPRQSMSGKVMAVTLLVSSSPIRALPYA
jgi:hypothetical protein